MRQPAIALLVIVIVSCGSNETQSKAPAAAPLPRATNQSGRLITTDGVVNVMQEGHVMRISYPRGSVYGEPRSTEAGETRVYRIGSSFEYEVKPAADGFRLHTIVAPAAESTSTGFGPLRWRVTTVGPEFTISDNEEGRNAIVLKRGPTGALLAIGPDGTEIGKVFGSAAEAVLLIKSIPQTERYILMAELMARQ